MGAIAEAFAAYAQPLLDQTDGSWEQMNTAFTIGQFCFNLALVPDDHRDTALGEMQTALKMDDEEFDAFRRSIVLPMIRRHQEMFPRMHGRDSADPSQSISTLRTHPTIPTRVQTYPGTDRYAPCPCNSGQKYKFCCGAKGR
jgi:hypothetical protein